MTQNAEFEDVIAAALAWYDAGQGVAIATVVETWGSAPRPVGSQLAINADGAIVGSVSGGCVEGAVVAEALDLMDSGGHKVLSFGVSDDEAFAVGLACGGQIRVLVQAVTDAVPLRALQDARAAGRPTAHVIDVDTGAAHLAGPEAYPDRFRADRSGFEDDSARFVTVHNPPLRMVIVGAVHIAQALVPMARAAGYAVTVVDPRGAFATPARFPDTALMEDWPDVALGTLGLDARTAVITLSHDPKIDDPALQVALPSAAFYVGALGSTRTHAKRVARLEQAGLTARAIARLHAPVGLDIAARLPGEIAVSILAEVTQVLRRP